ncbi:MAG: type III pantothenate kinase [Clostridia bacterium]|nr:type III pantothenate kinase [Clostridia bacterium]
MVLCLDVGNTNIKFGLFKGEELKHSWRMHSDILKTADDYGINVTSFFNRVGLDLHTVNGIIISSVVPAINYTLEHMCKLYFDIVPIFVGPGVKTGLNIRYDDAKDLGADRIVNSVAAFERFGGPLIVMDVGTALTFNVISQKGEFLGGAICPGIRIAMKSLATNTAQLPNVELIKPETAIGRSTTGCIQSGFFYGYVGMVDNMIEKLRQEVLGDVKIVATGGLVNLIADECKEHIEIDPVLTLTGLKMIYDKNN